MFPDIDLRPLIFFGAIGLVTALGGCLFVAYHIIRAMLFYVGAL